MRICVIGAGYVGLVTATCLSDFGNKVVCVDKDHKKVLNLKKGTIDFHELGLKDMLVRNCKSGRLEFTSNLEKGLNFSSVVFLAVGTPPRDDGDADLSAVEEVAERLKRYFAKRDRKRFRVIVLKSTVPVGTGDKLAKLLGGKNIAVVSNPEFLREGHAVHDFLHPDRIVIGSKDKKALAILGELYRPLNARILSMSRRSAELVKYASNAFLANKISFINEIAGICEKIKADVKEVAEGMGHDKRIGHDFLRAGIGYGGSCLPKDVTALTHLAVKAGHTPAILRSIDQVNKQQRENFLKKIIKFFKDVNGKTIGIWGLSFKPQTDDLREAPSIYVIGSLLQAGAKIKAYDPMTNGKAKKIFPDIDYLDDPYSVAKNCDALIVLTEWNEFREVDLERVKSLMRKPNIFDGRNIFNPMVLKALGFRYCGVGR